MKFSILAPHRDTDKWTVPISVANELVRQGHQIKYYSTFDEKDNYCDTGLKLLINEAHNKVFVPDIVLIFDFGLFTSQFLTLDSFSNALWVLESGDDPQNFNLNCRKLLNGRFDLVLSPDIRCVQEYSKNGIKSAWCPHFADETLFNITQNPLYDAVTTRTVEEPFFFELKKKLNESFEPRTTFLEGIEHSRHLMKGKIVIQNSKYKEITRRVFEGMMANRLVLTDRISHETGIHQIFKEDQDIVYFDSLDECIDKVHFFIKNENQRLKIANNGYNKVREKHTVKGRVSKLLSIINEDLIHKQR